MSNSGDKEDWAKDSGRLLKSVGGRLRGGGTMSRESRDSDSEKMFWPKPPPEEVVEAVSWGAAERDWGYGDRWELGRLECREFIFAWWTWTGELTGPLLSAAEWEHERGALDEARFIRKVPLETGVEKRADKGWSLRAPRFGGDVAAAVIGGVQAGVASSSVVRGGEWPANREWEGCSWEKES